MMFFQLAGVSFQVESDSPLYLDSFASKFKDFHISEPGNDLVQIYHHIDAKEFDQHYSDPVYHKVPYAVYKQEDVWIYDLISSLNGEKPMKRFKCSNDYTKIDVYHRDDSFMRNPMTTLTGAVSDQIFFMHLLTERQATFLHASGIKYHNKGFLFVGQSEAGKSTMIKLTRHVAQPLCDERIVLREWSDGFRIHGTWSHGELPYVSSDEASLEAIFFLHKAPHNKLVPIKAADALPQLVVRIVRALPDTDWWNKQLSLMEKVLAQVPLYNLEFDKSGKVIELLDEF